MVTNLVVTTARTARSRLRSQSFVGLISTSRCSVLITQARGPTRVRHRSYRGTTVTGQTVPSVKKRGTTTSRFIFTICLRARV